MSRIKRGVMTRKRHKKLLSQTKGYWGQRSNVFRRAKETLLRALEFAFIGRKLRKRDFRSSSSLALTQLHDQMVCRIALL